ncbi:MAG: ATP-binding cassette domain-containing protein [Chloroflexi bacterium CFX4]|nr:ATP-binding cassette domain-containing protein [Chloroflexi bacterium CFX4]MDL1923506.1 ATP-binding cassette domain-containing protein [Chloroflexi bacterium CFX3]
MTTIRLYEVRVSLEHVALAQNTFGALPPPLPNGAPRRYALDGINLEIRHGETMGILGPSGCGKSTLLRAIAGLVPLTEGIITYDEQDMNGVLPGERGVGIVFQNYALYPNMTSYENVGFFLRLRKRDAEIPQRVREVSRVMGIGFRALLDKHPGQLSGGERQRVAVARCIARDPKVFLFDEPLSNLDAKLRVQTRTELKRLINRYRVTGVYVTHDQHEALALCDRIAIMHEGQIEQVGAASTLYERPFSTLVATFFGYPPMNLFEGVVVENIWQSNTADLHIPLGRDLALGEGRRITLGARAEHMHAVSEGGLRGQVILLEPVPTQRAVLAYLESPSGKLAAQLPLELGVRIGDRIGIAPDPEHLHLFDTRSGRRL